MSQFLLPKFLSAPDIEAEQILRFLIARANIYAFNAVDLKTMAYRSNMRADMLSRFIREGRFTVDSALKIENACGREYVQWEWLCNPVGCMENGEIY